MSNNNRRTQSYRPRHKKNSDNQDNTNNSVEENVDFVEQGDETYLTENNPVEVSEDVFEEVSDIDEDDEEDEEDEKNVDLAEDDIVEEIENKKEEFYLLTDEEIKDFNNDMKQISGEGVNFLEEQTQEEDKKPHYVVQKNKETNKVEIKASNKNKLEVINLSNSENKVKVAESMMETISSDIFKFEIEIEMYERVIDMENNPSNVAEIHRKVENSRKNLEQNIKKQKALQDIITKLLNQ